MLEKFQILMYKLKHDLKKLMASKAANIMFSHTMKEVDINSEEKKKIPIFSHRHEVRVLASTLLQERHEENQAWGLKENKRLEIVLKTNIKHALGQDLYDFDLTTVTQDFANWIMQNKEIIRNPINCRTALLKLKDHESFSSSGIIMKVYFFCFIILRGNYIYNSV